MSDAPASSGSLADRITQPLNASSTSFTPGAAATPATESWADEVASPTVPKADESSLPEAQTDGAAETQDDSLIHATQYEVEVKLSDLQGDVNSPLHSISSFEDLGMYVHVSSIEN